MRVCSCALTVLLGSASSVLVELHLNPRIRELLDHVNPSSVSTFVVVTALGDCCNTTEEVQKMITRIVTTLIFLMTQMG